MPENRIRVALVDDQDLLRAGFAMLVNSQPDLEVVSEARDGVEALERLAAVPCDVVLMDIRMPRLDGVETTRRLLHRFVTPDASVTPPSAAGAGRAAGAS
ncbi:response regulator transcription factor [Micrococcales bacterium 31B]|nr:response regulator transcription factor [Micrococcales bacterium 31B]